MLTLQAARCADGAVLSEEQTTADSKEDVLTALSAAAADLRRSLGESLASVERHDVDLASATTASLAALNAYSQALRVRRLQGDRAAIPLLRRALELDPQFASANLLLGTALNNLLQVDEAIVFTTRAYDLRDKVSERERLHILGRYHTISKNADQAVGAYTMLLSLYPDDYVGIANMGLLLRQRGDIRGAIQNYERSIRLAPDQPLARLQLGYSLMEDMRFAEAKRAFEDAVRLQDSTVNRLGLYFAGVALNDRTLQSQQVEAVRGRTDESELLRACCQD